ncbi:Cvm1p PWA37_002006 [Arxiozyma heterogenica]|uniref:Uncharacterized protein n=1 Tax=Arxiozyma heterogenica TaxID=278026 RepID=A0AAN7WP30_9SACH|nr:hypothetical protein RI543_001474 [Kazachstania heterogenica]
MNQYVNNEESSKPYRRWFGLNWPQSISQNQEEEENNQDDDGDTIINNESMNNNNESWYQRLYHSIFWYSNTQRIHPIKIDENTRYSQLDLEQINYLENEALSVINNYSNSWCWFEDLTDIEYTEDTFTCSGNADLGSTNKQGPGVVSVFGTKCGKCPLPLDKSPIDTCLGDQAYVKNSILLPSLTPRDYLHNLPLRTKIANAIKEHYNYPNEKHLYLKKDPFNDQKYNQDTNAKNEIENEKAHKRHIIFTVVGWLPDKYEKLSIGEQRTAQYLSRKVAQAIRERNKSLKNLYKTDNNKSEDNEEMENNHEILSLSLECPLHTKDMNTVLKECLSLLKHWETIFFNADSIYFIGVYHSVPLLIELCYTVLSQNQRYGINLNTTRIGMLTLNSCLGGYRFWDHSVDRSIYKEENISNDNNNNNNNNNDNNNNNIEGTEYLSDKVVSQKNSNKKYTTMQLPEINQEYLKLEQSKEKQLFSGLNNNEIELLSRIKKYYDPNSDESKHIQKRLDWLLYNCDTFRLNLIATLYDNFMTITQKLAINYNHPKIIRNIWCDGKYLDIDLQRPENFDIPNFEIKTPDIKFTLSTPTDRKFEIILLNNLILTQNLGYDKFITILRLISPHFISRSFNENTIPSTVRKQRNNQTKQWLQELEQKWNGINSNINNTKSNNTNNTTINGNNDIDTEAMYGSTLPQDVHNVHDFLKYIYYQNIKNPELFQIYGQIYDDDLIYRNFIEIINLTRNPTHKKHLKIIKLSNENNDINLDSHMGLYNSILDTQNQYDLVWKFHEMLCNFLKLKNLPIQDPSMDLKISIKLGTQTENDNSIIVTSPTYDNDSTRVSFKRNYEESKRRITQIWRSYQTWDPKTRGLVNLKRILSVLTSFSQVEDLLKDIEE